MAVRGLHLGFRLALPADERGQSWLDWCSGAFLKRPTSQVACHEVSEKLPRFGGDEASLREKFQKSVTRSSVGMEAR